MATVHIVVLTVLVASVALVPAAPLWKQQEVNAKEGLIQYLMDFVQRADKNSEAGRMLAKSQFNADLGNKAKMESAANRKMTSKQQVENMVQTNDYDYPMLGHESQTFDDLVERIQERTKTNMMKNHMLTEEKLNKLKSQDLPTPSTKVSKQAPIPTQGTKQEVEQQAPSHSATVEDEYENQSETVLQSLLAELTKQEAPSPSHSTIVEDVETLSKDDQDLNHQILQKMKELEELMEKNIQLLARKQQRKTKG